MTVLRITQGQFSADGTRLLGPIDLEHSCKGITIILGPNGAGKSLFLGLAHGILDGASGQVSWDRKAAKDSRQSRGFMAQQTAVLRRSVYENVEFALKALGMTAADRRPLVMESLETARLARKSSTPAAALSGGEQRRMAMARALVTKPPVLLMDEPSTGLDPVSARELEKLVRLTRDAGTGVLMVSHNVSQAQRLADHILFLDEGQIVENAPADVFFAKPNSAAAKAYFDGELS